MADRSDSGESRGGDGGRSPRPSGGEHGLELDPEQLSPGALRGLIEEFVTREGTDYGPGSEGPAGHEDLVGADQAEWSLEDKVIQVYRQLASGEARIVFDLESESASILCTRTLLGSEAAGPPADPETGLETRSRLRPH